MIRWDFFDEKTERELRKLSPAVRDYLTGDDTFVRLLPNGSWDVQEKAWVPGGELAVGTTMVYPPAYLNDPAITVAKLREEHARARVAFVERQSKEKSK